MTYSNFDDLKKPSTHECELVRKWAFLFISVSIAPCQQAYQKPPSFRATAICMPTCINGPGGMNNNSYTPKPNCSNNFTRLS